MTKTMPKTLLAEKPFYLEAGGCLDSLQISYHTFGAMNAKKDNVVWVCHALTANSDPTDWWAGLVGNNCIINPEEHFIVCANIIGSCYGTTGPTSENPATGKPYFSDFPLITLRDMVNAHRLLAAHLGILKIKLLLGGSMGGQQAVEWAISDPDFIENLLLVASNAVHSPFGVAFNESQRLAVFADPSYFDNKIDGGAAGLKAARSLALLSYRTYTAYGQSQAETDGNLLTGFKAASYQQYQGEKLVKRFDAYSYVSLGRTMDSQNVGRYRGSAEAALAMIKAKTLAVSISSDLLFPPSEQLFLSKHIPGASYAEIDSFYGHDGFLLESKQLEQLIKKHGLL